MAVEAPVVVNSRGQCEPTSDTSAVKSSVAIAVTRGVAKTPNLSRLLGRRIAGTFTPGGEQDPVVVAWGRKASSLPAHTFASKHGLPLWRLEDGFIRSIGFGPTHPSLSLVVDDIGIYYDASEASRLERLISHDRNAQEQERAKRLIEAWRAARVSKYNHSREYEVDLPTEYVVVIDQTFGDASIRYGHANEISFARMLEAALDEAGDKTVVLKTHPEVLAGRKKGHFDLQKLAHNPRIRILGTDVHPVSIIEGAQAIYTVTSQLGFEGLLWGKPVRTFGMPFYAGWGLTRDELPAPSRRTRRPLEALVYAALIEYAHYLDPETGSRCGPERLIEWMGLQRSMRGRFPSQLRAIGFSHWKKPIVRDFFQGSTVHFIKQAHAVPAGATLITWGRRPIPGALAGDVSLIRLEDGFLRSVGLGANFVRPISWVVDDEGIYYDASTPSRLESLLRSTVFDAALIRRATALREAICAGGITKYNVGGGAWIRPACARRVILVPGQVETDASIRYGSPQISRNMELLQAVRAANPDAYLLYKPHPDVRDALRKPGLNEANAHSLCDEVVGDVPMERLLNEVDELHVLTSLAGFEALLRGRRVVCYGQPFYAGWGLTEDMVPPARRQRRLTLDELVAATLILYPTYVSRVSGRFTTPEGALAELQAWRALGPSRPPLWRRLIARLLRKE